MKKSLLRSAAPLVGVDFYKDPAMCDIRQKYGIKGEAITLRLLCAVKRLGYFAPWTPELLKQVAGEVGCSELLVRQLINTLVKWAIFDETLLLQGNVLSSITIQREYFASDAMSSKPTLGEIKGCKHLLFDPRELYFEPSVHSGLEVHTPSRNYSVEALNALYIYYNNNLLDINIKKEKNNKKKKKDLAFREWIAKQDERWRELLSQWLEYKHQRGGTYRSELSLDAMFAKLQRDAQGSILTAKEMIEIAIARNWQGFHPLKNETYENGTIKSTSANNSPINNIGDDHDRGDTF